MAICVVVLSQETAADQLAEQLQTADIPLLQCQVIAPTGDAIERIELLNPNLSRNRRQKTMARWLMPFGFLAGVTFTKITTLTTFASFGPWGEPLIGGLLGMGSGLMGSYAAAASVASDNEDGVRILRNRREEAAGCCFWKLPLELRCPGRPCNATALSRWCA